MIDKFIKHEKKGWEVYKEEQTPGSFLRSVLWPHIKEKEQWAYADLNECK